MKKLVVTGALAIVTALGISGAFSQEEGPPMWAWGVTTPAPPPGTAPPAAAPAPAAPAAAAKPADPTLLSVPGSKHQFTAAQITARFAPADWFPEDHPPMSPIVAHGNDKATPQVWACGFCHMPNGKGRPENANLAGLPHSYIVQQLYDFKTGLRKSSDPRKANTQLMIDFAKGMTKEEIFEAARYFSALPSTPWVKVIESDTAPKTVARGGIYLTLEGKDAGTEPLGDRIVETPISTHDFEVTRNPRSGFIAYVPKGSIKKGEDIVRTGATKTTPCTECHGLDLRGTDKFPPLAGRSPSYTVRQLYDMQSKNRAGIGSIEMEPVLVGLTNEDFLNIAAYLASLEP